MKNLVTIVALAASVLDPHAMAQPMTEPGGNAAATELALKTPDEYAWRLFLYINLPAKPGVAGVPDDTKHLGDPSDSVVWESWAMSSGKDLSETYPPNGAKPVEWDKLNRSGPRRLLLEPNLKREAFLERFRSILPSAAERFFPPAPLEQEVHANRTTYEFIRENGMYSLGGLEALLQTARQTNNRQLISFKAGSKEIKAMWKQIDPSLKSRYLWRETTNVDNSKVVWGLVSLHIITKDLPDWFWADFGHIDCETRQNACNIDGQEPALTLPVDSTTRGPGATAGKDGVRKETEGTVFKNYILRGTQTDFTTAQGEPTILSNPVIENGFQTSSCMSCHARAGIGPRLIGLDGKPFAGRNILNPGDPTLGPMNPALLGAGDGAAGNPPNRTILYLQTDFVWSAPFRATR
ncbi:hypothetical protein [Variovorax sp. dw_308]|uniref:hypothetical protein n=1 Tax=Variovorax sp. dw_308 TaxID=2721546 RepID=UPI001C471BCA|nr:hypothetical protein [Variovorax sp. dw_308]